MENRKIWFITRPERDPKFHRDALIALNMSTDGFKVKWSRNRMAHIDYEKALIQIGVKRENISNDGSGGRTWAAMLKTFSYVYTDEEGFLRLTKVGSKILEGVKVRENVTKQILTLQIPNAYFLESGFRPQYETGFCIRPARFVIKLTNQSKLDHYITKEEITYFVLTAKNDNELDKVISDILTFRSLDGLNREKLKQQIAEKYEHRKRLDNVARDFETAHNDVAHTFMLICEYTGLVEYQRGKSLRVNPDTIKSVTDTLETYDLRYPFNNRYLISLQRMAESSGLDIDSYKSNFYGDIKPATNKSKTNNKAKMILATLPTLDGVSKDELKQLLMSELSNEEADKFINEISEYSLNWINTDFISSYLTETDNRLFEDKTGELFKAIGFEVEMRPKAINGTTTEIEILLRYDGNNIGIVDAKNYKKNFPLSAQLASHMASEYIPNYDKYKGCQLEFFGYVTALDYSGESNLKKISSLVKRVIPNREVRGFMITANVLIQFLDYCLENELTRKERIDLFVNAIKNEAYDSLSKLTNKTIINGN